MEEAMEWLAVHWFSLIQSLGIVGAFAFNGYSLRRQTEMSKAEFLTIHTQNHREIWTLPIAHSYLHRVLDPDVDLKSKPLEFEEGVFVNLVLLHLDSTLTAVRRGVMDLPPGASRDIGELFALPIPRAVWKSTKRFRSDELIGFVEGALKRSKRRKR